MSANTDDGHCVSMWTLDETAAAVDHGNKAPHNKFFSKRMSKTGKLKVEKGGSASLSVVTADDNLQTFPQINILSPGRNAGETGSTDASLIRVDSARSNEKFDSTSVDINGQSSIPEPTEEFQKQLEELVVEVTNKVLVDQPGNIYEFLAEYLEDKIKREKRKVKPKKKHKGGKNKVLKRNTKGVNEDRLLTLDIPSHPSFLPGASPDISNVEYGVSDTMDVCTMTGSGDVITQCCFFNNYMITASTDTNIRIYDKDTGKQKLVIPNHKPVNCFVVVPLDDKKIIILIGSEDGQVPGWRVRFSTKCSAKFTVIIPMHQPNPIRSMTVSPRGKYLVSGCCFEMTQISLWGEVGSCVRGTLKTWDLDSIINYVDHPQHYYDDVEHLSLKTYKQIIARGGSGDQKVTSSYARLSSAGKEESNYGIRSIALTPDDSKILVGFGHPTESSVKDMKMIALLEAQTLETLWLQYGYFYQVNNIMSSPEKSGSTSGPWLFMVATEYNLNRCTVEIRPSENSDTPRVRVKFPWRIDFNYGDHLGGAFSPDGSLVATACGCKLIVFKAIDGQQVASYEGHVRVIHHVTFSEDGNYIATASADGTVKIWKAPQKIVNTFPFPSQYPSDLRTPSPKVQNTKDGVGKPVSLSSNLYQVSVMSPTENDSGSAFASPEPVKRLARQEPRHLLPSAYRPRAARSTSPNAFEQLTNHVQLKTERSRSPASDVGHQVGGTVTS